MKPRVEVNFDRAERRAFWKKKPDFQPNENEFLLNHARSGLLLALKSLHLPKGSKVGVMVYNCHTVMNAVAQAGLEVVFIDLNDEMRINQADLSTKADTLNALIVTHLLGIINDIEAIRESHPHLAIIEDCAHVFGKEIVGDFGVYSIGQGKLPSLGDGGILVVNNEKYVSAVEALYEALPEYSRFDDIKLYFRLLLTHWLHRKWVYGIFTSRWKQNKKPQSGHETIAVMKMSRGVRAMFALRKNDIPNIVKSRLMNAEKEAEALRNTPLVSNVLIGSNAFMLVARCKNPAKLKEHYAQNGIETATHFSNSLFWAREFGYQGDCKNAERLRNELLMIPVY